MFYHALLHFRRYGGLVLHLIMWIERRHHQSVTDYLYDQNFTVFVQEIIAREKGIRSEDVPEMPIIHDAIEPGVGAPRRIAKEGEEPTFRIGPGNWKPKYPQFLQHVVWPKENARDKYCKEKPDPDFIYADKKLEPVDITSLATVRSEQQVKSSS